MSHTMECFSYCSEGIPKFTDLKYMYTKSMPEFHTHTHTMPRNEKPKSAYFLIKFPNGGTMRAAERWEISRNIFPLQAT